MTNVEPDGANLAELVERAKRGDRAAWQVIVERFDDSMRRVVLAHGVDRVTCADVVQQAWLSAVANLAALRSAAALGAWLRSIARHECRRMLKARNREAIHLLDLRRYPDDEDQQVRIRDDAPGPEDELLRTEQRKLLRLAWRALPERDRSLLTLLLAEPRRPYAEISRHIGVPIGSIGPTRARCLTRLRNELKTLGVHDSWVAA
ncbi:MAG TPA: sigma-70 family RNA polymerase sigma factor [Actinophytocola sp.]|uniref:RNA polymerase sigma factor n=1 Tax=Actinophytocola sp. TaxID=1872138 RepID=UPI002DBEAAF5|nr:sigma-70 family RNA polymerase sigma factor [Actinophytocola sp.]HEU5473500.1 sigma-70 family RNA polymerase sigma factor [Actinophytocola sp.]